MDSVSFSGEGTIAERIAQGNKLSLEQKQFLPCNLGLFSSEADEIVENLVVFCNLKEIQERIRYLFTLCIAGCAEIVTNTAFSDKSAIS